MTTLGWAAVALFSPAVAALVLACVPPLRRSGKPAAYFSVLAAVVATVAAALVLRSRFGGEAIPAETWSVPWLVARGSAVAEVGLHVDGISATMLCAVTVVALAVQVFSLGYMSDEEPPAFGRYFTYHSLFLFSMLLLVVAPNLMQLFLGWELVGATSYLLIGFYYKKPSAARAAVKAFWTTKLGDIGFVVALVALYGATGAFGWDATLGGSLVHVVTFGLFAAVVGKSAQFPLHVWLPDAMEGPTPVSALLHAATMVAAGVYLVVRANPLFAQAPLTMDVMAYVGAFTALFAACIALVQTDIKKVLAYSTCSQLGYMIAALGAGSVLGGYFHLTTHAFFKALLFLAAGSVIHAVHSNEIGDMGGLFPKMRLTAITFVIGALSLAGVPGLAGFFSKELVLAAVESKHLWAPLGALLVTAGLTAFYMGRVVFLVFFGPPSERAAHAHESGASMAGPLAALAIPSLGAGYLAWTFGSLVGTEYHFHVDVTGIAASSLAVIGIVAAWLVYGKKSLSLETFSFLAPIGRLARGRAMDQVYETLYREVAVLVSAALGWFDRYVVDGVMNGVGWTVVAGSRVARRIQTGDTGHYLLAVAAGAIALVAWGLLR